MDEPVSAVPATIRSRLWLWGHRGCSLLIVAGCLMHATVCDRYPFPLAAIYYGLPRPLLLLLALIAAITSSRVAVRWFWLCAAGLFAAAVWHWDVEQHSPVAFSGETQAIAFWNVGRNLTHDVIAVDHFLKSAPALVGLVETGEFSQEWLNQWRTRQPDYELVVLPNDCLLAVRGKVLEQGDIRLPEGSFASWVDVSLGGVVMRVVMVDIAANVWRSRQEPILKLAAALNSWDDKPIIVMGDFNTPDESVWLSEFQPKFREVFRTAGSGYAPTWPWPCPVLKLDQVWVSREIDVERSWQTGTWRSDHRIVWAKIRWTGGTDQ